MYALRLLSVAILAVTAFANPAPAPRANTVRTPKGERDASTVHTVPSGGKVVHIDESTVHIMDHTGALVKKVTLRPDLDPPAPTPAAGAPTPEETGWVAYASWLNSGTPIGSFKTTWSVPPTPADNVGQTIFLFNSIEPSSFDAIFQPVLQWGGSAAGGGAYWAVATWYLYPGGTFVNTLIDVNVGQVLDGEIQLVGGSGSTYNYVGSFTNIANSGYEVDNGEELTWATLTLETYSVQNSASYPSGSTVFSSVNLELDDGTFPAITWSTVSDTADGITTTVNAEGSTDAQVTIKY
ncbi:hypothetical protein HMN09_00112100 [Mycena chlorophos]|uniref:Acid proteinase A n=1 Tax=Mycena chlorophos TaxID=658473 RepID=A0A8H6WQG1_MYCCL|nr:hypothetical protein HMN09_00112100 [Mycena chlorophos]